MSCELSLYPCAGRKPKWVLAAALAVAGGCALLPADPTLERPELPDRYIAPWVAAPLTVCLGDACDAATAARVASVGVLFDHGRFRVVAAVEGDLYEGELTPGFVLRLAATPALTPTQAWQASGFAHPEWCRVGITLYVTYGLADLSAVGAVRVADGAWTDGTAPLFTAAAAGVSALGEPSAQVFAGQVALALAADDRVVIGWGNTLTEITSLTPLLDAAQVEAADWRQISAIGGPHLLATPDGVLGLFFSARGKETADSTALPAAANLSVGYAASADGQTFEIFRGNPVHDTVLNFLEHADESEPSVAIGDSIGIMFHREAASTGNRLALAVHRP